MFLLIIGRNIAYSIFADLNTWVTYMFVGEVGLMNQILIFELEFRFLRIISWKMTFFVKSIIE